MFVCDVIKASSIGTMFILDNFAFGTSCADKNWAKEHYIEGTELTDEVVDVIIIRNESERCDCAQRFQITHSLGGHTGSGLGALLSMKSRDNYPSSKVSNAFGEPYNATLSIHELLRGRAIGMVSRGG